MPPATVTARPGAAVLRQPAATPPRSPGQALIRAIAMLDGLTQPCLQRKAYQLWQLPQAAPGRDTRLQAIASALIDLRRTGETHYNVRRHAMRSSIEDGHLVPLHVAQARAAALGTGEQVRILGEAGPGYVLHQVIGQDSADPFPAPWYVVAAPDLDVCRAHGADEVERVRPRH
jgi:hypothetical protein